MGSKARSNLRVILIGGSSHVGKSALARSLADTLGWRLISTDELARHPGRPWRSAPERVPDHVAEHYLTLPVDELIADVLHHYRVNVWPSVETLIRRYHSRSAVERSMVDKFVDRTLAYNEQMIDAVERHEFRRVDILRSSVAELTDRCLAALNAPQR